MTFKPIVVFASPQDDQAAAVVDRIGQFGKEALLVDPQQFPEDLRVSLGPAMDEVFFDGERLEPSSVYVRSLYSSPVGFGTNADADMAEDWRRVMMVYRERSTVISSVVSRWEEMGVPLYNPPSSSQRIAKPFQLGLLSRAGLPVPDTLWSNDPDAVRRFASGRRIAYKPINGGAATREMAAEDLTDERLHTLSNAPVTFQELLPGEDIRVYVIDGEIVASIRIETDSLDFRQNETGFADVTLPRETQAQCLAGTRTLGLRFTGLDLKRDRYGQLRFLEFNPSPMFVGFDARAGSDITGRLAAALIKHQA